MAGEMVFEALKSKLTCNYAKTSVKLVKIAFINTAFYQRAALEGRSAKSAGNFKCSENQNNNKFLSLSSAVSTSTDEG